MPLLRKVRLTSYLLTLGWAHTPANFIPFVNTQYPEDPSGPDVLDPDAYLWPDSTFPSSLS